MTGRQRAPSLRQLAFAAVLASALCAIQARAQAPASPATAPAPVSATSVSVGSTEPAVPPLEPEAPLRREIEISLGGGVSVDTIQVDGAAATGFLPQVSVAFHQGMLLVGAAFDTAPSVDSSATATSAGENRSGYRLSASVGPTFMLNEHIRLDLCAEVGLHHLEDTVSTSSSSYATSGTLPFFGVRPAVSTEILRGQVAGAVGVAAFFRLDLPQKQPSGLPDDGGHQLGLEAFLSLRIPFLSGK